MYRFFRETVGADPLPNNLFFFMRHSVKLASLAEDLTRQSKGEDLSPRLPSAPLVANRGGFEAALLQGTITLY